MGSLIGVRKVLAKRTGEPLQIVLEKISNGLKWCWKCRLWKSVAEFVLDCSRNDGRSSKCKTCCHVKVRKFKKSLETKSQKQKASDAIRWAIKKNKLKPVKECFCGCGKPAAHYHHHNGYSGHELEVIPLCRSCHMRTHCGTTK